jgi:hypothetical protein
MQHGNQIGYGHGEMSIRSLDMTREEAQRKSNEDYMLGRITKEEWDFQFEELGNVRVWNKDGKIHQLKEEHERLRTNNRTTK